MVILMVICTTMHEFYMYNHICLSVPTGHASHIYIMAHINHETFTQLCMYMYSINGIHVHVHKCVYTFMYIEAYCLYIAVYIAYT